MSIRCRRVVAVVILSVAVVLGGCGRPRYSVSGRAAYANGEAYTGQGFVVAEATIDGKPVSARAMIAADGTFTLAGRQEGDGVMAGTYRVRLVGPRNSGDVDAGAPIPLPFDKKFLAFETSGLSLEVGNGRADLVIDLGAKPRR
ncbi:MAG: hypothetical protein KGR24_02445 [Planctomycetes bacterium]|nr:hypothetical protein [Planctomycetota bacterium]